MAIAKMRKLNLVAMSYERDALLNALQETGAVEIKLHRDTADTYVPQTDAEELRARLSVSENALRVLLAAIEAYDSENNLEPTPQADGLTVTYAEFLAAGEKRAEIENLQARVEALDEEKTALSAVLLKKRRAENAAKIYEALQLPFDGFGGTAYTRSAVGTMSVKSYDSAVAAFEELPLSEIEKIAEDGEQALVCVFAHKEEWSKTESVLASFGFSRAPYTGSQTGEALVAELKAETAATERRIAEIGVQFSSLRGAVRELKIYCDYLGFALEKAELSEKFRATEKTLLLEGYVPADAENAVKETLDNSSLTVYYEFSDPTDEDEPPTLLKNKPLVANFEGVTNTYSAPNYREFDPNAVMAFFYSLFMGFIVGDFGYGLLMTLIGGWLYRKNKESGFGRMAGVFAVGGVFAIVWGVLFNSFFGLSLPFIKTVMPNPQEDFCTFVGISVPSVLVFSLCLGIVQLFAGYLCRAVQEWRRGDIFGGICDGIFWAAFSVGVELAIIGFVEELGVPILCKIGGITAGVSLVLAMLTAGRKEKFFGKFIKGFGAAYGVINYASDILSYARLYGLMLSGVVIAQIISGYSVDFITGGNILLAVLGVVIMLVGHLFNIALSLLGAYIHDARLQYVEFYGRFFEGEGTLFAPLGSERKYVRLSANKPTAEKK